MNMCVYQGIERKQFMAIDSVNNSSSNAGLYAGGAAVVGAGAGAAAGYLTKPFLKDGAPTDSFVKKMNEYMLDFLDEDAKKSYNEACENLKKIDNVKNADELKDFIRNNKQECGVVDTLLEQIDEKGFEQSKKELKKGIQTVLDARDKMAKKAFEWSWDSNKGSFVRNAENVTEEGFNAVKKAARSIQGKYAMMYAAIGAGVLGTVGLLCGMLGGSKEQPAQADEKVDMQA